MLKRRIKILKKGMELKKTDQFQKIKLKIRNTEKFEIEIGCGNGHFITEYAKRQDSSFLIGVELKKGRYLKALAKVEKRALKNTCVIHNRAEDFIRKLPPESVDNYHIYFPDPWPKTKHRKRRLLRKPNLDLFSLSMKQGGKIHFATDFFDYSVQAKILFILHPDFEIVNTHLPEEVFLSIFANKFKKWERPFYCISAEKK